MREKRKSRYYVANSGEMNYRIECVANYSYRTMPQIRTYQARTIIQYRGTRCINCYVS
jgi:hypothetical protein